MHSIKLLDTKGESERHIPQLREGFKKIIHVLWILVIAMSLNM